LQCLADVDKPDSSGNTPLHLAVSGGRLGIAALLIAANADPNIENCCSDDAMHDLSDDTDDDDEWISGSEQIDGPVDSKSADESTHLETFAGVTPRQLAAGDDKVISLLLMVRW